MAGGHIDGNTNNPAENIGQWKAGQGRPICVFSANRLAGRPESDGHDGVVRHPDLPRARYPG